MRKLLVTCQCGQQMQVPRSALGKVGVCPTCGESTRITSSNTSPLPNGRRRGVFTRQDSWKPAGGAAEPPEEAKQRFGQAVDHYYAGRYGEALAIFDSLAKEFPGNPDIDHGRMQCYKAMRRASLSYQPGAETTASTAGVAGQEAPELDAATVRRFILEKMLHGRTEATQLQAAELACKVLGMLDGGRGAAAEQPAPAKDDAAQRGSETSAGADSATEHERENAGDTAGADAAAHEEEKPAGRFRIFPSA